MPGGMEGVVENSHRNGSAAFRRGDHEASMDKVESASRLTGSHSVAHWSPGEWDNLCGPNAPI